MRYATQVNIAEDAGRPKLQVVQSDIALAPLLPQIKSNFPQWRRGIPDRLCSKTGNLMPGCGIAQFFLRYQQRVRLG